MLSRAEASQRGRQGADALLRALKKLLPIARRVEIAARVLAVASATAVVLVALALFIRGFPGDWLMWLVTVAVVAVLAAPPFVLWLFASALREALLLPERLRAEPDLVKGHAREIGALVRDSADRGRAGKRHWLRGLPRDASRAAKLLLEAHRDLPDYGAAMRLISPPFLIMVALAVPFALAEVALVAPVWIIRLAFW